MKKSLHILIALFLLVSTMGISITRHYCGDVLSKVYISSEEKHCCGDKEPEGCCHSESDIISLEDKFKIQSFNNLLNKVSLPVIADLLQLEKQFSTYSSLHLKFTPFTDTSPPVPEDFQVSLQVFRL